MIDMTCCFQAARAWRVAPLARWCAGLLLLASGLLPAAGHAADCPVPLVEHPVIGTTCPKVGRIGKVRIAVPQHYLLGPFVYKGVDIWNPESFARRPRNPTLDTEIDNFAISVRFPGFRPVESRADREEYLSGAQPASSAHRWLHVAFESRDEHRQVTKRVQLERWLHDPHLNWGPFNLDPQLRWGLQHYVSAAKPTQEHSQREIFYDAKSGNTLILCETRLKATPGKEPFTSCEHAFNLDQEQVSVQVFNVWSRDDVKDWGRVEQGVAAVFRSFVVR